MATQEDEYAQLLARANAEFEELGYVTENTNEALLDAKTGIKNFSQAVAGPATQAIKSLGGVVGKTATAMYKGEKGAKAFDGALDSASDAADMASKALFALGGPLGMVAGAIAFLIGKAAKAVKVVNQQLDKEQEAFQNLSKSGMAASDAPAASDDPWHADDNTGRIKTREDIARAAGISSATIGQIDRIRKTAAPELVEAVRSGAISINAAAAVATLPSEAQVSAVAGAGLPPVRVAHGRTVGFQDEIMNA
jgi:hypothetical protein